MAKVMLVEDSSMQRMAIKSFLESDSHDVSAYENFDLAKENIMEDSPDIFILDIETTGEMKLQQFVESIQRHGLKSPIIVLSGKIKHDVEDALKAKGVTTFLWKPIREADLNEAVKDQLLRQSL